MAAWIGFTLPSAILMTAFALGAGRMTGAFAHGALHGLKLVAVAVVAQAVIGMAKTLTPDAARGAIAVAAIAVVTILSTTVGQIAAISFGAACGVLFCRHNVAIAHGGAEFPVSKAAGLAALSAYVVLLFGGPALAFAISDPLVVRFNAFYRSGALVFGGGHVVLPLLKKALVDPGWVSPNAFLDGYGAAQGVPGPLFTFAAYLGAASREPPNGVMGAGLGLVAIFLPGLLALVAALPHWRSIRENPHAQGALRGANAAVVGILASALYNPVWTTAVLTRTDIVLALTYFFALMALQSPPVIIVAIGALLGGLLGAYPSPA